MNLQFWFSSWNYIFQVVAPRYLIRRGLHYFSPCRKTVEFGEYDCWFMHWLPGLGRPSIYGYWNSKWNFEVACLQLVSASINVNMKFEIKNKIYILTFFITSQQNPTSLNFIKQKKLWIYTVFNPSRLVTNKWTGSSTIHVMACRLLSAMPLSEPIKVYWKWDHCEQSIKNRWRKWSKKTSRSPFCSGVNVLRSECFIIGVSALCPWWKIMLQKF